MRTEKRIVFDETDAKDIELIKSLAEGGRYFPSGTHPIDRFGVGWVVDCDNILYAIDHITAAMQNIVTCKSNAPQGELCADAKLVLLRKMDEAIAILDGWAKRHKDLMPSLREEGGKWA